MEKTIDFTIVESLKDQKKIHMLIINVPYVPPQLQSLNKMDYLLYILFLLFFIDFIYSIYTYYKIYKIWKNIEQNEVELNYYYNKDNYDYINMDSGKNNRENKT